jgi:hypothetical protein
MKMIIIIVQDNDADVLTRAFTAGCRLNHPPTSDNIKVRERLFRQRPVQGAPQSVSTQGE